jgi:glutamate N-acetyltransferase / amino-acid N-acetyltransferase
LRILDNKGVTAPLGFTAAGIAAGIKPSGAPDLALVLSDRSAAAAAVYTTNRVQAAPLHLCRQHLQDGSARAVVLNSGNANACTGKKGMSDALRMCQVTAAALGMEPTDVLVCSTGVIGVPLPMAALETGIPTVAAALDTADDAAAARAIMTTDTVPKSYAVELDSGLRIGGMSKGSGMIAPNMATMLAVVTTDAAVEPTLLRRLLVKATQRSFNCITVDGDMSTNDNVILLANGAAGQPELKDGDAGIDEFYAGLETVCRHLARLIARDGEGATKLVPIRVCGADDESQARQVGLSVANSNLVKTAVFGRDPNWGRILCAIGYAGVELDPDIVEVSLCGTPIYAAGAGLDFDREALTDTMGGDEVTIDIDLKRGDAAAEIFTCDFSYDYVRINAEYTT